MTQIITEYQDIVHQATLTRNGDCFQKGKSGWYFLAVIERLVHVQDGNYHREGGPAIIDKAGHQFWYQYGKLHREDGPARMFVKNTEDYWFKGIRYPDIKNDIQLRLEVQRWKRQINKSALKESVLLEHKNKKEGV